MIGKVSLYEIRGPWGPGTVYVITQSFLMTAWGHSRDSMLNRGASRLLDSRTRTSSELFLQVTLAFHVHSFFIVPALSRKKLKRAVLTVCQGYHACGLNLQMRMCIPGARL